MQAIVIITLLVRGRELPGIREDVHTNSADVGVSKSAKDGARTKETRSGLLVMCHTAHA